MEVRGEFDEKTGQSREGERSLSNVLHDQTRDGARACQSVGVLAGFPCIFKRLGDIYAINAWLGVKREGRGAGVVAVALSAGYFWKKVGEEGLVNEGSAVLVEFNFIASKERLRRDFVNDI